MTDKKTAVTEGLDVDGIVAELVGVEAALEEVWRRLVRTTDTLGSIARFHAVPARSDDHE